MSLRLGVLGLGSVFWTPYRTQIEKLSAEGKVSFVAAYDPDPGKREAIANLMQVDVSAADAAALIARDDIDAVLILTSMNEHGPLAQAALEAGKHVLVEKPMATTLAEGQALLELSHSTDRLLVCAPHIVLSPTYREIHRRVNEGTIGDLLSARARYGWAGPWWGKWFYQRGGGAMFDLGVYNITALCGLFGPVRRVTALVGTAIPERVVDGEMTRVEVDDNAHILLDFGHSRFASVMTGFTIQKYRSPAIELYGADGVIQLLGDDWAPEGFEQWRNETGTWELFPETDPAWPWTEGLRHLVECAADGRPTVTRPEHALHVLEIVEAARRSAAEGRAIEITTGFPALDYTSMPQAGGGEHRTHDPRSLL